MRMALTGGIASGKSFVAEELRRLGAVIVDADVIAREVVEPGTSGLAEIVERFGPEILRENGSLDRAKLGEIVFADDEARQALNEIVHPLVRRRANEIEQQAASGSLVVHVIPLLVEAGLAEGFEHIMVVDVEERVQLERLIKRDGLSVTQAQRRLNAQATRQERGLVATWVIDNDGSVDQARQQVRAWWRAQGLDS